VLIAVLFGGGASAVVGIGMLPSIAPANPARAATLRPPPPPAGPKREAVVADPGIRRFSGVVRADLSRSLADTGVPERQGREYVALLARAISLADGLSVDDRFDLIVERRPDGSLGQLIFAGLDRVGRADVELLKWTDGKSVIWVNADGIGGQTKERMRLPVNGRVTSGFGERFHPILGYDRFHGGIDVAAAWGSPITAAAEGRVVSAGWNGGYGREVIVAHAAGLETRYGHMSWIAVGAGSGVQRGQVIGYVGSSGLSTGPHVHFEVLKNGRLVNPATVKFGGGPAQLEGAQMVAFHNQLRQLLLASTPAD